MPGFSHNRNIQKMYGSDIDEGMIAHAKKNAGLLTASGLKSRRNEIERLYKEYGKLSHGEALSSCDKLKCLLNQEIPVEIFKADCTETLPKIARISLSRMYLMETLLIGRMKHRFP